MRSPLMAKVLINGKSGTGKTNLLRNLRNAFVVSRDGKQFSLKIPHMTIPKYIDMNTTVNGGDFEDPEEGTVHIQGIFDKLEAYHEKYGEYPETVVIDSVSKLMQDAIDTSNLNFTNFEVHSNLAKEIAILTAFIQEDLVANGVNVVLINHVMDNEKNGLVPVGQGKFRDKGGFYSEVDESVLISDGLKITHRGSRNQARTLMDDVPDVSYVENTINPLKSKKLKEDEEYFDLQKYIDKINAFGNEVADEYEI
jgi:hypothetical protein